jgi:hypothetical protein
MVQVAAMCEDDQQIPAPSSYFFHATVNVNFDNESLEFHHANPEGAFDVLLSADKGSNLS